MLDKGLGQFGLVGPGWRRGFDSWFEGAEWRGVVLGLLCGRGLVYPRLSICLGLVASEYRLVGLDNWVRGSGMSVRWFWCCGAGNGRGGANQLELVGSRSGRAGPLCFLWGVGCNPF